MVRKAVDRLSLFIRHASLRPRQARPMASRVKRPIPEITRLEPNDRAVRYPPGSYLNASIGSTTAARLAGYKADSRATAPSRTKASNPVCQVGTSPAKYIGMGIL